MHVLGVAERWYCMLLIPWILRSKNRNGKTLELRLILHELPLCTQTRFSMLAIAPCVPRQRKAEYNAEINIAAEKATRDKLANRTSSSSFFQ